MHMDVIKTKKKKFQLILSGSTTSYKSFDFTEDLNTHYFNVQGE